MNSSMRVLSTTSGSMFGVVIGVCNVFAFITYLFYVV